MTDPIASLRAAARLVGRVDREGAYSNVAVDRAAPGWGDPGRVRALVFDTLRRLGRIDAAIVEASGRSRERIDPDVLDLLRVTVAELASGRPPPVVVDGGVEAIRSVAPRATGFANAVLRRVAEAGLPSGSDVPEWLSRMLSEAWGAGEAQEFLAASDRPPAVGIRVPPGVEPPPGSMPVEGIAGAFLWRGGELPDGVVVQDPASVAAVLAVEAARGLEVLEVGAAPGGKTGHLVDLAGDRVAAVDVHPRRTRSGRRRVPSAQWLVADGRRLPFAAGTFDRILVDAPCTGLGVLRRRPEIRHRVTEAEVSRLAALQSRLVEEASGMVRRGGRLVYSVCTVTPAETIDVVAGRGFRPPSGIPGRLWGDGLLLAPHLGPTDGMFISVLDV